MGSPVCKAIDKLDLFAGFPAQIMPWCPLAVEESPQGCISQGMKLYLLRHAEAHPGTPDDRRALTSKGVRTVVELAAFVKKRLSLEVDEIRHSPYVRARETAELLAESAGWDIPVGEVSGITPMDDPGQVAAQLAGESRNVMLVGHNPHLDGLAALLMGSDMHRMPVHIPKCALLKFSRISEGQLAGGQDTLWSLQWMLTPKLFS